MSDLLVGFDSAWTDNQRNPGAITALRMRSDGRFLAFEAPQLATFAQAIDLIESWSAGAAYMLVALDQPTIVPNMEGCRPVDRVAGSLISRLGGGVQPARRGGGGSPLFGDAAPVWGFLARLGAVQNPARARTAVTGRYLMEVFPALSLPALVPEIWRRRAAAKYNPAAASYRPSDWPMVTLGLAAYAERQGAAPLAAWARDAALLPAPRKADQDRLDAAICLSLALGWRRGGEADFAQFGDESNGYMVTAVSAETFAVLRSAAETRAIPVNHHWSGDAPTAIATPGGRIQPGPPPTAAIVRAPTPAPPATRPPRAKPTALRPGAARITTAELRTFLIGRARQGLLVAYGDVAAAFGFSWTQGFGASLKAALKQLGTENRARGEPLLMTLVVNKETRLPGEGYFMDLGHHGLSDDAKREILRRELDRCRLWPWSETARVG